MFAWETPIAPSIGRHEILLPVAEGTANSDTPSGLITFTAPCLLPHLSFRSQRPAKSNGSHLVLQLLWFLPMNLFRFADRLLGTFAICFFHDFNLLFTLIPRFFFDPTFCDYFDGEQSRNGDCGRKIGPRVPVASQHTAQPNNDLTCGAVGLSRM